MALTRPLEAVRNGKNWCPEEAGARSAGEFQELPPLVETRTSICPWPEDWAAWKAMTSVPWTLSAARYGLARSKRGKVNPVEQLNGASPHSRALLPENWPETNGVYVTGIRALLNVCPKSVEDTNPAPFTAPGAELNAPPVFASHETFTCPDGPIAIEGPWLPQIPEEILSGGLNVAP